MSSNPKRVYWAVIPAAGRGERMGGRRPKQYLPLAGRSVLEWSLEPFLRCGWIAGVVVVLAVADRHFARLPVSRHRKILLAIGGATRAASVLAGLARVPAQRAAPYILVHDAARPCLNPADLARLRDAASDRNGGLLAIPAVDTVKQADSATRVAATLDRSCLWLAQTPQMFRLDLLRKALLDCGSGGIAVTDEAGAMERAGHRPRLVTASPGNLKVTYPQDLALAEFQLTRRQSRP